MKGPDRRLTRALAGIGAAAAALVPISNPDLFWHLSAARWIVQHRAIPSRDWLSARAGAPWADFEALSQVVFGALEALGGTAALWCFKVALFLGVLRAVDLAARDTKAPEAWRDAGVSLCAAALLTASDLRPDLFSVLAFTLTLRLVERARRGEGAPRAWALGALFSVWANLHAGFAYGLALVALYTVLGGFPWRVALAAPAGALLTTAPIRQFEVLWEHARDRAVLTRYIAEWAPLRLSDPRALPHFALIALSLVALGWVAARRRIAPAHALLLLWLGYSGTQHGRLGVYFAVAAAVVIPQLLGEFSRALPLALTVLATCFAAFGAGRMGLGEGAVYWQRFPMRAAAFLAEEAPTLGAKAMYNPWHWGGVLGWRLHPPYRVMMDGRYIFHDVLPQEAAAHRAPRAWQAWLDAQRVDLALLPTQGAEVPLITRRPDGSLTRARAPYYMAFMPPQAWALVAWDEVAMVWVRRASVPPAWLASREYVALRPGLSPEASLALRGPLDPRVTAAETARHEASLRRYAPGAPE